MSGKIAMRTHLPEHQECTSCRCFSQNGYILRDSSMARFVCEECYDTEERGEYSLAAKIVEVPRSVLQPLVPEGRKPGFHAGYLLGKGEKAGDGYRIVVEKYLDSIQSGKGTANFFNKDDVMRLRTITKTEGLAIVGLFRTSPSGSPDFNLLDNKTLADMLGDMIYMIIGGCSEIQIAVKDKYSGADEIGVILG